MLTRQPLGGPWRLSENETGESFRDAILTVTLSDMKKYTTFVRFAWISRPVTCHRE